MEPFSGQANWLAEQCRRNRQTQGAWECFADHRGQVTALLTSAAKARHRPSLCLLGAGNCNDVDLAELLSCYDRIHLVDWDAAALVDGVQRQGLAGHCSLILMGGVDLLGLPATASQIPLAELFDAAHNHQPLSDFPPVDVVASLCVLSQLIEATAAIHEAGHPPSLDLIQAVRRRHLELMVALLRPSGCGLLITDLVSSETAPQLSTIPNSQLPAFLATCIESRNFFTGLNPAVLLDVLRRDFRFESRLVAHQVSKPWKWSLGPRTFAVYAIGFQRRAES